MSPNNAGIPKIDNNNTVKMLIGINKLSGDAIKLYPYKKKELKMIFLRK